MFLSGKLDKSVLETGIIRRNSNPSETLLKHAFIAISFEQHLTDEHNKRQERFCLIR